MDLLCKMDNLTQQISKPIDQDIIKSSGSVHDKALQVMIGQFELILNSNDNKVYEIGGFGAGKKPILNGEIARKSILFQKEKNLPAINYELVLTIKKSTLHFI